ARPRAGGALGAGAVGVGGGGCGGGGRAIGGEGNPTAPGPRPAPPPPGGGGGGGGGGAGPVESQAAPHPSPLPVRTGRGSRPSRPQHQRPTFSPSRQRLLDPVGRERNAADAHPRGVEDGVGERGRHRAGGGVARGGER